MREIIQGENLELLRRLPEAFARLVYIDPPFNTGKTQTRTRLKVRRDEAGSRRGFGGHAFTVEATPSPRYADRFDDYVAFLMTRVEAALRCTTQDASIFVHVDPRESHYVKVALDGLLGRRAFMNEIIWAYDYGARTKRRWSPKHDVIFWYARDPERYVFDYDAIDRIPYMAPGLVSKEKAERGKTPTDVWWHTIVPTNGREKTGYPTQKPLGILERIVKVHSAPGDVVLDFFAGSGTTGEAAARNGRGFVLVDREPAAIEVMERRLAPYAPLVRTIDEL
ncbi:MAG: site-specific DNA-methyltransferase [Myxococcales bacterium]|nr:site-specific DNA-methyltransferase [Myxococcales bacterium]